MIADALTDGRIGFIQVGLSGVKFGASYSLFIPKGTLNLLPYDANELNTIPHLLTQRHGV